MPQLHTAIFLSFQKIKTTSVVILRKTLKYLNMVVEIKVDVAGIEHPLMKIFGVDGKIDHLYELREKMVGMSHEERVATLGQQQYRGLIPAMAMANYQRMCEQTTTASKLTSEILHHPKAEDLPGNFSGLGFVPLHHFGSPVDGFMAHSGISAHGVEGIKRKAEEIVRGHPKGFRCYGFIQLRKAKFSDSLLTSGIHLVMFVVSVDGEIIKKFDAIHHPLSLVPDGEGVRERVAGCFGAPVNVEPLKAVTEFQKMMERDDARAGRPSWVLMGEANSPDHRHVMKAISGRPWQTEYVVGLDITKEEAIELITLALFGQALLAEFEVATLGKHWLPECCFNMFGRIFDKSINACCRPVNDVLAAIIERSTEWFRAKGEATAFEQFFDSTLRTENFQEVDKDRCVEGVQVMFNSKGLGICANSSVSCFTQLFVLPATVIPGHDELYAFFVEVEIEELRRILRFLHSAGGTAVLSGVAAYLEGMLTPFNPDCRYVDAGLADPGVSDESFDVEDFKRRAGDSLLLLQRRRAYEATLKA